MKKISFLIMGVLIGISCSTLPALRKFQDRRYRPAQDFEANEPVGKLAFRYCSKTTWITKKCKQWKSEIVNFCDQETFNKFRDGGFVMIAEKRID